MATAPGDKLQVVARQMLHGSFILNVFHVEASDGAVDDGEVKDDMVAWINDGYATIEDLCSTDLVAVDIDVINLTQAYHIGSDTWLSYTGGTVAADALPSQDAALVSFPSPTLGARGRKFLAGLTDGQAEDSLWGSPVLDALGDFGFWFYPVFSGFVSGGEYIPVSRRPTGAPGLFVYQPFTGFSVSTVVARMGSRKRGVGI